MIISIIGTGYVGLVTGSSFSEMGYEVICLDIDEGKINNLKRGKIPIYEPGLEEIVKRNVRAKRLTFTSNYEHALKKATICFLALPSPSREDGSCNLQYIEEAAINIAPLIKNYLLIVNKSTVPPGTTKQIRKLILSHNPKANFDVVSNPEFLKEGSAISDCMKPDRIIIGSDSEKATAILKELYAPFNLNHERIIEMDPISAEMTKYAANAMLASRISFMNEMAEICKRSGANINEIRKGIGSDSRIGHNFLYAGIGYGGSCFPKDIKALIHTSRTLGYEPELLRAIESINLRQKELLVKYIINHFKEVRGKTIAIWGLAFKPDTDDIREAPSLKIIELLLKEGAILKLFDPMAMNNAKKIVKEHPNIFWCKDEFEAAKNADAIALITEWKQFRLINFKPIIKSMKSLIFFDGRNQYKPQEMQKLGFKYIGIGIPSERSDR